MTLWASILSELLWKFETRRGRGRGFITLSSICRAPSQQSTISDVVINTTHVRDYLLLLVPRVRANLRDDNTRVQEISFLLRRKCFVLLSMFHAFKPWMIQTISNLEKVISYPGEVDNLQFSSEIVSCQANVFNSPSSSPSQTPTNLTQISELMNLQPSVEFPQSTSAGNA